MILTTFEWDIIIAMTVQYGTTINTVGEIDHITGQREIYISRTHGHRNICCDLIDIDNGNI